MSVTSSLLLATLLATQGFESARLESGSVEPVPIGAQAAGVVALQLSIDATGAVSGIDVLKDVAPFTDVVRNSVRSWRFAPARSGGQAVESEVLVAGLFRPAMLLFPAPATPQAPPPDPNGDAPFPTSVSVPPYPPTAMGTSAVLVEAIVGVRGKVGAASVKSPASAFDEVALEAAREWTFRPARHARRTTEARVYLLFSFRQPH